MHQKFAIILRKFNYGKNSFIVLVPGRRKTDLLRRRIDFRRRPDVVFSRAGDVPPTELGPEEPLFESEEEVGSVHLAQAEVEQHPEPLLEIEQV